MLCILHPEPNITFLVFYLSEKSSETRTCALGLYTFRLRLIYIYVVYNYLKFSGYFMYDCV